MTFIFGTSFWILPQAYLQALEYLKDNAVVSAVAMTDGDKKESVAVGVPSVPAGATARIHG